MPRPTSGRLSRRAGGAHNVVPPTARRSACLPSLWQTCLLALLFYQAARFHQYCCMSSSYATMSKGADAVRQRRSASSLVCYRRRADDEIAPPLDSGKSSNRRKPPPSPPGVLGQQASAARASLLPEYSWLAWRRFRAIRRLPTVHWRQVSSARRRWPVLLELAERRCLTLSAAVFIVA